MFVAILPSRLREWYLGLDSTHLPKQVSVFLGYVNPLAMAKRHLIRRSSLPRPLQNLANGTLCDTHNPRNINLSVPFTREPNNKLPYFTWNIAWHGLNYAKFRPEGRFNRWDSSESNPIRPFRWSPPSLLMNLFIQTAWNIFAGQFLTKIH